MAVLTILAIAKQSSEGMRDKVRVDSDCISLDKGDSYAAERRMVQVEVRMT